MKKVLGLSLVLFFLFSLLPANAGPAYERLKEKNIVVATIHVLNEYFYEEFRAKLLAGIELMKGKTSDDPISSDEYGKKDSRYCLGYQCSTQGESGKMYYYFWVTRADKIFSNDSFRQTIRKYPGRYIEKLIYLFRGLSYGELEKVCPVAFKDLALKGFTGRENYFLARYLFEISICGNYDQIIKQFESGINSSQR